MIRKVLVYAILLSMVLHCAGRLGFIDHIYSKRKEIAFAIGLIAEVPISLCGSNHDHAKTFIAVQCETNTVPALVIKAETINLFCVSKYCHRVVDRNILYKTSLVYLPDLYRSITIKPVYHPPSLLA
jgi:hypothetical protein